LSGWIKWEKELEGDPRMKRMLKDFQRICNADALHHVTLLCGSLLRLWVYADSHIREDNTLDMGCAEIDEHLGVPGFCSILPASWLVEVDEHCVELPDFLEHNGTEAKKKALTGKRVANHRQRKRNADALPDQTRPDQTKPDQNPSASATPARTVVSRGASTDPEWLLDFKLAYPPRAGDQGWRKAVRAAHARIAEGHTSAEFVAGARRYAAFCDASGKLGSEYVKQACTFLGPDKPFLLPWHAPPKAETAMDRILRANSAHKDDRVIEHEPEFRALTG
jgi:hypothetical protein